MSTGLVWALGPFPNLRSKQHWTVWCCQPTQHEDQLDPAWADGTDRRVRVGAETMHDTGSQAKGRRGSMRSESSLSGMGRASSMVGAGSNTEAQHVCSEEASEDRITAFDP